VIGEGDFDRAIFEQFGVTVAGDVVHFVKSGLSEVDQVLAVYKIEARPQRTEGDLAVTVGFDRDDCRLDQIEMVSIPKIGLDDPPAADQAACTAI